MAQQTNTSSQGQPTRNTSDAIRSFFNNQPDLEMLVDVFDMGVSREELPWLKWPLSRVKERFMGEAVDAVSIVCTKIPSDDIPGIGQTVLASRLANLQTYLQLNNNNPGFLCRYTIGQNTAVLAWQVLRHYDEWIHVTNGSVLVLTTGDLTTAQQDAVEQSDTYLNLPDQSIVPTAMLVSSGNSLIVPRGRAFCLNFMEDTLLMQGSF